MISNPELPVFPLLNSRQWPRMFSHWQLLSLVPGVVHRLQRNARVLEIEVGGGALLHGLASMYPASQFIGLTSRARARAGQGAGESSVGNLHFRTVDHFVLERFRKVDLVLAMGGVSERAILRQVAGIMNTSGYLLLREEDGMRHSLTQRVLREAFATEHEVRLPEDPDYVYYIARTA